MKKLQLNYLLVAIAAWLLVGFNATAQDEDILEKLKEIAIVDQKVMMPMRDGIRLSTDIFRPKTDEPVPVILSKTPYNFNSWGNGGRCGCAFRHCPRS